MLRAAVAEAENVVAAIGEEQLGGKWVDVGKRGSCCGAGAEWRQCRVGAGDGKRCFDGWVAAEMERAVERTANGGARGAGRW